ncbi:MAG: SET domain-containing protein-lysine N-methyltransferase [Chthoniobacterales bacterium]
MKKLAAADREFLASFEACAISGADFHHREHLRVAYLYLSLHPYASALEKMETGLRNLLAHLGAPRSKYHHTLTEAWLRAVQHFIDRAGPTMDFEQFLETASQLLDEEIMGMHYTTNLIWSDAARASFIEPDLQPIPIPRTAAALSYLSPKTEVRESPIHGRGLFAKDVIARDEIVAVKGGHIITREQLRALQPTLGAAEIQIADDLFVCPVTMEEREGSMIFSNHSCEPNLGVSGQITFVAMRAVQAGDELTHDWAMTDNDESTAKCHCGALNCRGNITGQDWQRPELQARYAGYFSSYLQHQIADKYP